MPPGLATHPQETQTGFTRPGATYARMRNMEDASAAPMHSDVQKHVVDPAYRAAWDAWYANWRSFFDTYAGADPSTRARVSAVLFAGTDELARQAETFRTQLMSFYQSYPLQRDARGGLVPPASGIPPTLADAPTDASLGLPWWVWALGLGALGSGGYLGYLAWARRRAPARRARR